jgi:predicted RNase H-like HicB family nuclease
LFLAETDIETHPFEEYSQGMNSVRYVYWQDGNAWLGHLEEFPDYLTQGESLEELQENLRDILADLLGGETPKVRHVAELPLT